MTEDDDWELDVDALAAEAEVGYWCREPIGGGKTCNQLGIPIPDPPTPDRIVLCAQHRLGWGRDLLIHLDGAPASPDPTRRSTT